MYKRITKNVAITVFEDHVQLHLKKYKPVFISTEGRMDEEIRLCTKCKSLQSIYLYSGKQKYYCKECAEKYKEDYRRKSKKEWKRYNERRTEER